MSTWKLQLKLFPQSPKFNSDLHRLEKNCRKTVEASLYHVVGERRLPSRVSFLPPSLYFLEDLFLRIPFVKYTKNVVRTILRNDVHGEEHVVLMRESSEVLNMK